MKFLVCIKQVVDTSKMEVDPTTGRLKRNNANSIMNPLDLHALEAAFSLRDEVGGTVTVITMGPPQAAAVLKDAVAMGADEVYLVTDRAFGGADTLATSYTLAQAIEKLGTFDLIFCGQESIDSNTAQIGPEIAATLGIADVSAAVGISYEKKGFLTVKRQIGGNIEVLELALPAVVTATEALNHARYPSIKGLLKKDEVEIGNLTAVDLPVDPARIGMKGSPTQVRQRQMCIRDRADQLGEEVAVVLIGADLKDPASSLIPLGADKVYVIDHPLLAHYDGKAYQKALAPFLLEKKPDTIIFGATPFGRDLAPRLAAELDCGVTADVPELSADTEKGLVIWSRPAMDGNIMADIVSPDYRPQVGTVRPGIFKYPQADASRTGEVISLSVSLEEKDLGTVLKEIIAGEKDSHPVENAKVVVAGGRGIRTEEEWAKLHELADLLGAAVGCSRPIAELGWEPHRHQIGQTGKGVAPKIYFALGISGAMQHMCAVNADIVIAVNKDPKAPIMEMADYAVEADLKDFLPLLIEKIKALKSK